MLTHATASGLDRRALLRLRRGLWPVEAELDLHGCTQDTAHRRLEAFLASAESDGRRCVLVITGRGLRGGDTGVLREAVPRWLNQHPNRRRVLAFCYATPARGGQGALFVLVRRVRR